MKAHPSRLHQPKDVIFQAENGFLLVQIDTQAYGFVAKPVELEGKQFQPKDELHITILSEEAADQVRSFLVESPSEKPAIQDLIDQHDWTFQKQNRYYHVQTDEDEESLIEMVEMPGLASFFATLSRKVGANLELPPTHVTLYTYNTSKGIGLPTDAIFGWLVTGEVESEVIPAHD